MTTCKDWLAKTCLQSRGPAHGFGDGPWPYLCAFLAGRYLFIAKKKYWTDYTHEEARRAQAPNPASPIPGSPCPIPAPTPLYVGIWVV